PEESRRTAYLIAPSQHVPAIEPGQLPAGKQLKKSAVSRKNQDSPQAFACGYTLASGPRSCVRRAENPRDRSMPKFVIARELTGAGKLPRQELQAISQKSCRVLREMGPQIQWQQSFVTDDKIYCVYIAPDEEAVKTHARKGGFPANRISTVRAVIDPTTAEVA